MKKLVGSQGFAGPKPPFWSVSFVTGDRRSLVGETEKNFVLIKLAEPSELVDDKHHWGVFEVRSQIHIHALAIGQSPRSGNFAIRNLVGVCPDLAVVTDAALRVALVELDADGYAVEVSDTHNGTAVGVPPTATS